MLLSMHMPLVGCVGQCSRLSRLELTLGRDQIKNECGPPILWQMFSVNSMSKAQEGKDIPRQRRKCWDFACEKYLAGHSEMYDERSTMNVILTNLPDRD
jgi:hypothetical protein